MSEQVTVRATGRVEARPDTAVVELGTEARGQTMEAALAGAGTALTAITGVLREAGLTDDDLRTQGPSSYTMTDEAGRVYAYVCSFQLSARTRDLGEAGGLAAAAVAAAGDAGRVHGVRFVVTERDAHEQQAREQAVARARARAEELAELVDRRLGRAVSVAEGVETGGARPMRKAAFAAAADVESGEVEPGVEQVVVAVEITWAFAD